MLTPIYVNFIFKNAHLLASLGDKGSFRCANILQCHPLGWLRGVLAMFVANSLRISYILKLGKCPVILKSQPKELNLVHRSSRQFYCTFDVIFHVLQISFIFGQQ